MSQAIDLSSFTVELGGSTVVRVAELRLEGTGWIGLVGANGSGKTTLMRAIAGRLPIASGEISINGRTCAQDRPWRARNIGFMPEPFSMPGELTGLDILSLVGRAMGGDVDAASLSELREALGLSQFWNRRVGSFSAGMKQRLAIYAAFIGDPGIVMLDEPFNWLDPVSSFDARIAISNLSSNGHLIISALHDLTTMLRVCREGYLLADGGIEMEIDADMIRRGVADMAAFEGLMIERLRGHPRPVGDE